MKAMYPADDPRALPGFAAAPVGSRAHEQRDAQEIRITLHAHNALTAAQAQWFLLTVALGPLLTAGYCLIQGFWPVLPFAGLELLLLYLALRWSMHQGRRRELIAITAESVTIHAQLGARQANTRFPRHWTMVKLRVPSTTLHPTRLYLESRGRACEVGGFLTDDERRALAVRLHQLVGAMNSSPAL